MLNFPSRVRDFRLPLESNRTGAPLNHNPTAQATFAESIPLKLSKSAIVRLTFRIRSYARRDKPGRAICVSLSRRDIVGTTDAAVEPREAHNSARVVDET